MEITVPDGMLMNEALIEQLTTQMLDAFARKAHTHSQSDITGLETALAGFLKESDLDKRIEYIDLGEIAGDNLPYYSSFKLHYYSLPLSVDIGSTKIVLIKLSAQTSLSSKRLFGITLPAGGSYLVSGDINKTYQSIFGGPSTTTHSSYGPSRQSGNSYVWSSLNVDSFYIESQIFCLFITRLS